MATDSVTVSPTFNGDSVPLTSGMIVRLKPGANNNVVRAQADSAPHVQGVNGVVVSGSSAPTGVLTVVCAGRATVQMESGLTPSVSDTVYVSATVAGKGTNVVPAIVLPIGAIADISDYARLGTVDVDVVAATSEAGGGGAFPGYGAAPPVVAASLSATGTASTVARSDHDHGQNMVAQWTIANPRIYAVDGVNGLDTNTGFADAASGSTADVAAATVAAGLVAKKTLAGLGVVFPRQGAGRIVAVVIAAGTYIDGLEAFLGNTQGYAGAFPLVRGTVTNATAGSVAFSGTANELICAGGVTATGTNVAGYNPTAGATTTVIPCQKAGGGAAALPAEPAVPLGSRIRFDSATATVALRNWCAQVVQVATATITVSSQTTLPSAPGTSDVFYLEQPGVVLPQTCVSMANNSDAIGTNAIAPPQIVGIKTTGGAIQQTFRNLPPSICFCEFQEIGGGEPNTDYISTLYLYANADIASFPQAGGTLRVDRASSFDWGPTVLDCSSVAFGSSLQVQDANSAHFGDGTSFAAGLIVTNLRPSTSFDGIALGAGLNIGEKTNRIYGPGSSAGLNLSWCSGKIAGWSITGMGAKPAIRLTNQCFVVFDNTLTGSTGNTDVGLDLTGAAGATIVLGSNPTVTGTAGDVRLSDGTIISWATAAAGVIDTNGNRIYGTGAAPLGTKVASAATTVALGNVAPATVTSSTPTAWTPIVINGVKYLLPLWPST